MSKIFKSAIFWILFSGVLLSLLLFFLYLKIAQFHACNQIFLFCLVHWIARIFTHHQREFQPHSSMNQ